MFRKIIKKLVNYGVIQIVLNGGEVTTHPKFIEILKEIKDYNIAWRIITNATLVSKELANKIAKYEPSIVTVSLDGPDKETHEFLRGEGTFDRTLNGIKFLKESGTRIKINTVLHKKLTRKKLEKLAELVSRLELKIGFIGLYPTGRALEYWSQIALNDYELYSIMNFIIKNNQFRDIIRQSSSIIKLDPNTCGAARTYLTIDEKGYTYPCDLFVGTDFYGPNILNNNTTIEDVWYSPQFLLIRKILTDIVRCSFSEWCYRAKIGKCKPCPALAYRNYKSVFLPDPKCIMYPKTLGLLLKDYQIS